MLLEKQGIKLFVYREPIDMRAGFERLHGFCTVHMEARMNEGNAYIFFGKNRSRLKILVYDGSGLVLVAKKIERKSFMAHEELLGRTEITMEELRLIFHGSVLRKPVFGIEADELDRKRFPDFAEALGNMKENRTTQWEGFALPKGTMNAHY
jgi:transposase